MPGACIFPSWRATLSAPLAICFLLAAPGIPRSIAADESSAPVPQTSAAAAAAIVELRMDPPNVVLSGLRNAQGLRITATDTDGRIHDVTDQCSFTSSDPDTADVSESGLVTPRRNGTVTIVATLGDKRTSATITTGNAEHTGYNFRNDVLPVMENLGCNQMGCHGSPKGKKRLQLSLFSADPQEDFRQLTQADKEFLNGEAPDRSWLLLKAICEEDHGGGDLTAEGDPAYNVMLEWIRQGAPEGAAADPTLLRIDVSPTERTMIPGEKQHLLVEAHYSDGSMRDVTDLAWYRSSESAVAKIDEHGQLEVAAYGETIVLVRYGGMVASCQITAAQPAAVPYPELPQFNRIDELVDAKLRSLNIIPSGICSDEEFVRRVYLDVTGLLPTSAEVRRFLTDQSPNKRAALIDDLLERPEYADFYAIKWGDILQINRDEPARLQDKGMWVYYRWLWNALDSNMPMDQFTRELLTARGSAYESGPANFFRVGEGAQGMAEHASTVFLGVRLDCAHCHNHPFEQYTLDDNLGMAAFFSQVRSKRTQEQDEEIIYTADSGSVSHPDTKQRSSPMYLGGMLLAPAEKSAVAEADATKSSADQQLAEATRAAEDAAAKLTAHQKQAESKLTEARKAVEEADARLKAAREAMDRDQAAVAAAQRTETDATTRVGQAAQVMQEAEKAVADADALLNGVSDAAAAETAAAAQKAAADQMAAARAQMEQAERELAAAAERVILCRKHESESAARLDAATSAATDRSDELKTLTTDLTSTTDNLRTTVNTCNVTKSNATKEASRLAAIHRKAVADLTTAETTGDLRSHLVDWMVAPENPWYARNMSNRVWAWLMGRGIVNEPDDFRSTNPPSNAELLDYLAESFLQSGYDTKAMFRLILNSRTYQTTSTPNEWNRDDAIHYSHYHLKRLMAEQLAEAISQATDVPERYAGLPLGTRATQLPDVSMRSEFLDLFGRPKRATPVESERTCETHIGQSLQMISSEFMAAKLRSNDGLAAKLAASELPPEQAVDELYLTTLSRYPTTDERAMIFATPIEQTQRREKLEDLLWVLMNTKEFLFNH
ncbi:MAG: DUF1549 domain-containing protein [Planctomycetaceae bacterium]|nr:DUF1549 domain-containing protein [Planctomycetaceae bacterium]